MLAVNSLDQISSGKSVIVILTLMMITPTEILCRESVNLHCCCSVHSLGSEAVCVLVPPLVSLLAKATHSVNLQCVVVVAWAVRHRHSGVVAVGSKS